MGRLRPDEALPRATLCREPLGALQRCPGDCVNNYRTGTCGDPARSQGSRLGSVPGGTRNRQSGNKGALCGQPAARPHPVHRWFLPPGPGCQPPRSLGSQLWGLWWKAARTTAPCRRAQSLGAILHRTWSNWLTLGKHRQVPPGKLGWGGDTGLV